jgi:hypothetical protein
MARGKITIQSSGEPKPVMYYRLGKVQPERKEPQSKEGLYSVKEKYQNYPMNQGKITVHTSDDVKPYAIPATPPLKLDIAVIRIGSWGRAMPKMYTSSEDKNSPFPEWQSVYETFHRFRNVHQAIRLNSAPSVIMEPERYIEPHNPKIPSGWDQGSYRRAKNLMNRLAPYYNIKEEEVIAVKRRLFEKQPEPGAEPFKAKRYVLERSQPMSIKLHGGIEVNEKGVVVSNTIPIETEKLKAEQDAESLYDKTPYQNLDMKLLKNDMGVLFNKSPPPIRDDELPGKLPGAIRPWSAAPKVTLKGWENANPNVQGAYRKYDVMYGEKKVGQLEGVHNYSPNLEQGWGRSATGRKTKMPMPIQSTISEPSGTFDFRGIDTKPSWQGDTKPDNSRKGYGTAAVGEVFDIPGVKRISGVAEHGGEARGFWESQGMPFGERNFELTKEDYEAAQLARNLEKYPPAEKGPLNPQKVYPNKPSVKNPKFMEAPEYGRARGKKNDPRPRNVTLENVYVPTPKEFRRSIVVDGKEVPANYYGYEVPDYGFSLFSPYEVYHKGNKSFQSSGTIKLINPSEGDSKLKISYRGPDVQKNYDEKVKEAERFFDLNSTPSEGILSSSPFLYNRHDKSSYVSRTTEKYRPYHAPDVGSALAGSSLMQKYTPETSVHIKDIVDSKNAQGRYYDYGHKEYENVVDIYGRKRMKGMYGQIPTLEEDEVLHRSNVVTTPLHEYSHAIFSGLKMSDPNPKSDLLDSDVPSQLRWEAISRIYRKSHSPSIYGTKNYKEDFAESLVQYMVDKEKLHPQTRKFMEDIERKNVAEGLGKFPTKQDLYNMGIPPKEYLGPEPSQEEIDTLANSNEPKIYKEGYLLDDPTSRVKHYRQSPPGLNIDSAYGRMLSEDYAKDHKKGSQIGSEPEAGELEAIEAYSLPSTSSTSTDSPLTRKITPVEKTETVDNKGEEEEIEKELKDMGY